MLGREIHSDRFKEVAHPAALHREVDDPDDVEEAEVVGWLRDTFEGTA